MEEQEKVEILETEEVTEEEVEEVEVNPEIFNLSEEEAKEAAKNVEKLIQVLGAYRSPQERWEDRIKVLTERKEALPEDSYKRVHLQNKIDELERKLHPKMVWDSKNGTYRKKDIEKTEDQKAE